VEGLDDALPANSSHASLSPSSQTFASPVLSAMSLADNKIDPPCTALYTAIMVAFPSLAAAIEARRQEISELRQRLALAEAELRGLELAETLLRKTADDFPRPGQRVSRPTLSGDRRATRIKSTWLSIMRTVTTNDMQPFSLADVEAAIRLIGADISRSAARSQMHNYVQADLLERINAGQFRLTEAGRAAVKQNDQMETAPSAKEDAAS